jgi:hypothetical protein
MAMRVPVQKLAGVAAVLLVIPGSFCASAQSTPQPQVCCTVAALDAVASGSHLHDAGTGETDSLHTGGTADSIVVGFVGGFVKRNDRKHEELRFADRIREKYSHVHVEVYGNHQGATAFLRIRTLLDTNHDGRLNGTERRNARIILYGHSWGGSEVVELARQLGKDGIPVLLTIQIDSITKPGQEDFLIPANVASAVNFYQTHGLLHGVAKIRAADPETTKILGNFQMTYKGHPMDCAEYPWYARMFTRPHIEIESDPRVWADIGSLIDAELTPRRSAMTAQFPSLGQAR